MKREIARVLRGNFRGVCPKIGRLRVLYERISPVPDLPAGILCRFDFWYWSDTHGRVYRYFSSVRIGVPNIKNYGISAPTTANVRLRRKNTHGKKDN